MEPENDLSETNIQPVSTTYSELIKHKFSWKISPNWLRFLIIVVLIIGIFFRFANLDRKFYWIDETYTSLRVSGYTEAEMLKQISYQQIISPSDLQKYQQINSEKTVTDTLNSLTTEDPQHPPLYYILARYWAQWFGSSVTAMRSLPAVISLLVFPCIYWLAWELFESSLIAWIAIALAAISPYNVLFAQEARQYSLWTVTTILSSAALLRSMRHSENQNPIVLVSNWTIYAVTLIMGLYTHLLFACVAAAHAIYVAVIANWRDLKSFIAYYIAALAASIAFMPVLLNTVENFNQVRSTTIWAEQTSLLRLVTRWVGSVSVVFLDFGIDGSAPATQLALLIPFSLIILALVGFAIYSICRKTPMRVWLFILLLIATTFLFLAVPDIIKGGRRSANPRYLVPCYVGIQLAVAYLLSVKINGKAFPSNLLASALPQEEKITAKVQQQKLWKLAIVALFSAGIISCGISSKADNWWNKGSGWLRTELEVANIVDRASDPLIVSDANIAYIMSLSYRLQPKVKLLIEPRCYTSCYRNRKLALTKPKIPIIPNGFSEIFLYRPSSALRSGIEQMQNYKIESIAANAEFNLWKITKK
jgi:uncharacterized membrane protein